VPNLAPIKFQPQLANVAGVPQTIVAVGGAAAMTPRVFCGQGPPSVTTLLSNPVLVKNPMYVAAVAGQTLADLYMDVTNWNIHACSGAGTNATSQWQQISGGAALTLFQVYNDLGNGILGCWQSNGAGGWNNSGIPTGVARPFKIRPTIRTETLRGVAYNYTYVQTGGPGSPYWTRNVTGSDGSSYTEVVLPDYLVGDSILAAQLNTGLTWMSNGVAIPVNYIDIGIDGRAWANI